MKIFVLMGAIAAFGWVTPLAAQEQHPTSGLISNTVEANSLYYECEKIDAGILECSFVQTSVRRKANPAKLQERLDKARAEFAQQKGQSLGKEVCDNAQAAETALSTGVAPPGVADSKIFTQKYREMTQTEKNDNMQLFKAMNAFCREPVEARYLDMTRITHQRDTRTCLANSNRFTQRFRRVKETLKKSRISGARIR